MMGRERRFDVENRNMWTKLKFVLKVTWLSVRRLLADNCMRNAAALSFYALFSVGPIILLASYVAGMWAAEVNFQEQIAEQFSGLMGERAAAGIEVLISTLDQEQQRGWKLALGLGVLAFSATNIFIQVQTTFNEIFRVESMPSAGLVKQAIDRVMSLGIIVSLGFLLIVSLVLDSAVMVFHDYLFSILNDAAVIVVQVLQMLLMITLISGVIYAMFHFLPDVHLSRRSKLQGSVLVAVMLLLGKYAIGMIIARSELSQLGGAAASVLVLMLWVYYTAIILFFGAEVVSVTADEEGAEPVPRRYARRVYKLSAAELEARRGGETDTSPVPAHKAESAGN
tara:strand:+ start:450 stop:1466 length:1017 start_codon:yes stop_codon:yes gene_type:complete